LFFFFGLSEIGRTKRPSVLNSHRELQYITRKLGIDNQWVLNALRKINLLDDVDPDSSAFDEPLELVRIHWIQDQYGYFEKALRRDMRKLRVQGRLSVFLFAGSFLSGLTLVGIEYLDVSIPGLVVPLLGAMIGISAGLGGILKTYAYTMGTRELTGRYRIMNELFGNAANRIGSDESNRDAVFEQLWWEALMENIEWFSLKDSRLIKTLNIKKVVQSLVKLTK
jgi:hypothetical protein